jgi:diguanylate cyclase
MKLRWTSLRSRSSAAASLPGSPFSFMQRPHLVKQCAADTPLTLELPHATVQAVSQEGYISTPPRRRQASHHDDGSSAEGESSHHHESRTLACKAFWPTLSNVIIFAGSVDVFYFVLFMWLGVPELAWPNISSVALYAVAYFLVRLGWQGVAIALICLEVVLHAVAGTLLIGWDSGFHYHMLFFLPAIVVGSGRRHTKLLLSLLFVCYVGLDVCSYFVGPTNPISEASLAISRWANVAIAFAMFSYVAIYHRNRLHRGVERIRLAAMRDPLTGLPTQQHFLAMAEHELARQQRTHWPIAIAVVDVDLLDQANKNDRETGDAILARVGRELHKVCRLEDVVARWDCDEFVLLLPDTSWQDAMAVAERVRQAVAASDSDGTEPSLPCTVSIGVSELLPQETLRDVFTRADQALYRSKLNGRNRVSSEPPPPFKTAPEWPASVAQGRRKNG